MNYLNHDFMNRFDPRTFREAADPLRHQGLELLRLQVAHEDVGEIPGAVEAAGPDIALANGRIAEPADRLGSSGVRGLCCTRPDGSARAPHAAG